MKRPTTRMKTAAAGARTRAAARGTRSAAGGARPLGGPPPTYRRFVERFPELGRAWELIHEGGEAAGPLDGRTRRLIKLAVAIGARQEGAVHSGVRKALALGITVEEMEQVVALAAGTLGMPAAVAGYSWIHDELDRQG